MITFDLNIEDDAWREIIDIDALVSGALSAAEGVANKPGEVSVLLTSNAKMLELNAQFRGKDMPTDVLSFPSDPMDAPFLGDIAAGYQICATDAAAGGKTISHHLSHLVIHGYLHLLGFDHETDTEADEMQEMERRALASLGIADPYLAA